MTAIATVVLAIVGVLGILGGLLAFIYARGDKEGRFQGALDRNTEATDRLTDKLDGVVTTLHAHDIRLTRLEAASPNGSTSPVRDPSPIGGHPAG